MKSLSHKLVAFLAIPLTLSCCQREEVYDPESNPREAIILTRAEIDCNEGGKVFSFKMLEKIDSLHKGQSYLFSPLSLFFTYGMTALESDEGLKQAICVALDVDDIYDMNQYAKTILDALPKSDNQSLCSIANIFLYSQDQGLDPSFTGTLTDYYDAFVHKLSDLEDNHSLNLIKQWVKNKTNGHIPNYTPWMYSPEDHYFANVVCFSGKWMIPFDESTNEYFYTESGKKVKTKMMTASKKTRVYWEGKGYSVLELHYGNASFLMNVILPDKGVSCNEIIPCLKEEWNQSLRINFMYSVEKKSFVELIGKNKMEKNFDLFMSQLQETNQTLDFFCDFNINQISYIAMATASKYYKSILTGFTTNILQINKSIIDISDIPPLV